MGISAPLGCITQWNPRCRPTPARFSRAGRARLKEGIRDPIKGKFASHNCVHLQAEGQNLL